MLQPISYAVMYFDQNWRLHLTPPQSLYLLYSPAVALMSVATLHIIEVHCVPTDCGHTDQVKSRYIRST